MSYVPPMTGYGQAPTHSPYLDATTITQQEKDATTALNGQASMQQKMLEHQYTTQVEMIKAECTRNITMAIQQQFKHYLTKEYLLRAPRGSRTSPPRCSQ